MIRHAESAAQIGAVSSDVTLIPLSDKGHVAAKELASQLPKPDLIVVSKFIRTRQTAQPLIDLYPNVPVEEWPVHEFTYLATERCTGMTAEQRAPLVGEYWERNEPEYADGDSAESFNQFIGRAGMLLERCAGDSMSVYIFSHALFMQAVRMMLTEGVSSLDMTSFRKACFSHPIRNLETLTLSH